MDTFALFFAPAFILTAVYNVVVILTFRRARSLGVGDLRSTGDLPVIGALPETFSLLRFLVSGEHTQVGDPALSRLVWASRGLFAVSLVAFAALLYAVMRVV